MRVFSHANLIIAAVGVIFLVSSFATAMASSKSDIGEGYAQPEYKEVIQSVVLLGGLDINQNKIADLYAKLIYCDIFKKNYKNDFEWNNIRRQIIARVLEKREMYRTQYQIKGVIRLGRYDFDRQTFPITADTSLKNVGSMDIFNYKAVEGDTCYIEGIEETLGSFSRNISLYLNQPLTLEEIKIPMDEAEAVLTKMSELGVKDRSVFVRFRFKFLDVPLVHYSTQGDMSRIEIKGQVQHIDFFFDEELTQWIASAPVATVQYR